jgi:hypothetical protein
MNPWGIRLMVLGLILLIAAQFMKCRAQVTIDYELANQLNYMAKQAKRLDSLSNYLDEQHKSCIEVVHLYMESYSESIDLAAMYEYRVGELNIENLALLNENILLKNDKVNLGNDYNKLNEKYRKIKGSRDNAVVTNFGLGGMLLIAFGVAIINSTN